MYVLAPFLLLALAGGRYTLAVSSNIMIAHSFEGEQFGPAQRMHGATYEVEAALSADALRQDLNWVMDIGQFTNVLDAVLAKYHLQNLDETCPGENTTTEFMCRRIYEDLVEEFRERGEDVKGMVLNVGLRESSRAGASYEEVVR